jgi:putative ABC transport system ATP-binding protein
MQSVLETRSLSKTYSANGTAVQALRGVDLLVTSGELVAVMGPSGCGKSTLLHLLGGLDRPSSGEVHLNGRRVDTLSEAAWAVLRRTQVGLVFQFFNLIGNLTVADNIELPALMAGVSPADARRRREALLADLSLPEKGGAIPAELSGGQQQRVALARALVNQPAVLLADEPTGNLDSRSTADVLALLRRMNAQGQTILLVTHDPRVASIADRVIAMRDGQIKNETSLEKGRDAQATIARLVQLEV